MRAITYRYRELSQDETAPHYQMDRLVSTTFGSPEGSGSGVTIAQRYEDRALPAQPGYRPALAQLLADNQTQPADVLLVSALEALGDTLPEILACLETLAAAGTQVWLSPSDALTVGTDLDAPQGNAMLPLSPVTLNRADLEAGSQLRDRLRQRQLRLGHERNRLRALPPPGKAPYGYRRGQDRYLVDRTAAPVITAFVNEFVLYGSLRGAVRFVEHRFGKRIAVSTGRRWLTHPVYRGDLQYQDGQVIRNAHAAIISRDEAAQIDRLLRRNRPLPPRTAGASRSLAGLVQCQACGSAMTISSTTVRGKAEGYLYLRPARCPRSPRCSAIAYDQVLEATITEICQTLPQAVAQHLATVAAPSDRTPSPSTDLQAHIDQRESALAQLPQLLASGVLDTATADLRRYTLQGEIAQLEAQRAALPPVNLQELAQSVSIPQFWRDLSEAERRFFFREFLRRIDLVREEDRWRIHLVLVF